MNARRMQWSGAAVFSLAVACGGGSAAPEPAPVDDTEGSEAEAAPAPVEEAPPPALSHVRVIHASADPAASPVSIALDTSDGPVLEGLTYRTGSAYADAEAGHHSVFVRGPDTETGSGTTIALAADTFSEELSYTGVLISQNVADSPFGLFLSADARPPAAEDTSIRFFHALDGVDDVDVCIPGPNARAEATTLFADVSPRAFGATGGTAYSIVEADGEVTIQLRAHATPACHGRVSGVARFTPTGGTSYTLVAVGRTTGRPRVDRELLVCADAPSEAGCTAVPLGTR